MDVYLPSGSTGNRNSRKFFLATGDIRAHPGLQT